MVFEESKPDILSLVAEHSGSIVGHVALSPVTFDLINNLRGYILAPLGVKSGYQKKGIGSRLVEAGKEKLTEMEVHLLFVYGDSGYYSRFGFEMKDAEPFIPPYQLQYPFGWQAVVLNTFSEKKNPVSIGCVNALMKPELW